MKHSYSLGIIGVAAAIAVGAYIVQDLDKPAKVSVHFPSPMSAGQPEPAPEVKPAVQVLPAPLSKSEQFERLKKVGTPQAAYEAYKLVRECVLIRSRNFQDRRGTCGDLTPAQLTEYKVQLERAAEAGVHGAASDWALEAAFARSLVGQKGTNPQTEAQWRHYVEIGAEHGDPYSLTSMSAFALERDDLPNAIRYATAAQEALKMFPPPWPLPELTPEQKAKDAKDEEEVRNEIVAKIGAERLAQLEAEGRAMTKQFKGVAQ